MAFWHSHACRYGRVVPVTRAEFWAAKRSDTVARDERNSADLKSAGWQVLTLWECETNDPDRLTKRLASALDKLS
jgi:DNA mismatch endonuclease (patch repair protein)